MIELLANNPDMFVGIAALLGLIAGSFLNVVIHRLPIMIEREWQEQCAWLEGRTPGAQPAYNLVVPRSACPECGHVIRWYENVPIVSWLLLRGRCASCRTRISLRYPLVEAMTGMAFAGAAWHWGLDLHTIAAWCMLAMLIALAFIDLDTQLLPDNLTLPLAWMGLLVNLDGLITPLDQAVIGAVAGYLSLWLVYQLFKQITGKEGMGFGDFKLLAALGAWLGWKLLLPVVMIASVSGALAGLTLMILAGHARAKPIPFGPWLTLGGLVGLFWGRELLNYWLG